jgi:protein TonB
LSNDNKARSGLPPGRVNQKIGDIMKKHIALWVFVSFIAGCASTGGSDGVLEKVETTRDGTSTAYTFTDYKQDIAQRISQVNSTSVYPGRPQALLRSVVVLRYHVDGDGRLTRSEIIRSNRDPVTEATAMASLKNAAPFPKPAAHLLNHGRVEISESWLFNTDGRFQLRSVAQPQMNE